MSDMQQRVVAFLIEALARELGASVETIDTHISRIFLAGDRAFKLKRAVKLPYADFSTSELRYAACRREVELNRLTAPDLYLGVRRIILDTDGQLSFNGDGELVDAIVEMRRFDQAQIMDRMADAGQLTPQLMADTASMIARFHENAPIVRAGTGTSNLVDVLDINRASFDRTNLFISAEVDALDHQLRTSLFRHADVLNRREEAGKVRRCHGDLHLRNICVFEGRPLLFDCIEFNEQLATVDVLYDLAFLLMDLTHRGHVDLANLVANRYFDETDNENGFALLPFLMAIRASVRAHVTATQAEEAGDPSGELSQRARSYFDLARSQLAVLSPRLIAIGGLSGSGKTVIAEALAPRIGVAPGARIIESDRIRKALHGVPAETRLPPEAYRPEVSERVYGEMARRAETILEGSAPVVADAVFQRPENRERIEHAMRKRKLPFLGVWLDVPEDVLKERVRQRQGGPSDATVDVLARQMMVDTGDITWHRVNAARQPEAIIADILSLQAP